MAIRLTEEGDTITVTDNQLGVPNGDPETSYTLRLLTKPKYKELEKPHKKRKANPRTHQMEDLVDTEALGELDGFRKSAMLEMAGLSQVQAAAELKASSFRSPEALR